MIGLKSQRQVFFSPLFEKRGVRNIQKNCEKGEILIDEEIRSTHNKDINHCIRELSSRLKIVQL